MFGFGVTEMVLVAFVAILLFPPRELPKVAREVARLYGYARRTADQFRSAILEDEELNKPIREIRSIYHETRFELRRAEELAQRELAKAKMEARMAARSPGKVASSGPTIERAGDVAAPAAEPDGAAASGSGSTPEADLRLQDDGTASSAPEPESLQPLSTAGEPDAPPPGRVPGGPATEGFAPPAPQLRRPVASVPRGTVTPHGVARKPAGASSSGPSQPTPASESAPGPGSAQGVLTAAPPGLGAHSPDSHDRADDHLASPLGRDDSAAGAA